MRRFTLVTLAAALTVTVAGVAPAAKRQPVATAKVVECETGLLPSDRFAVFRAAARRVKGAQRMWIKLRLKEQAGSGRFRGVAAPGLGVWRKSRAGVGRFVLRQRVLELAAGATYRVVAQFRWYGARGELLRRATRRSRGCKQAGLLPNLRVARIGQRKVSGAFRYAIDVVNRGRAPAAASRAGLAVDGAAIDTADVPALAPGELRRVFVNGPACTRVMAATADVEKTVAESRENDNTRASTCP